MAGDLSEESMAFIAEHMIAPVTKPIMQELKEIKDSIHDMAGGTQAFREWRAGHTSIHERIDTRLENQGQAIGKIKGFCDAKQKKEIEATVQAPATRWKKIRTALTWVILISTSTTALIGLAYVAIKFVSWIERLLKI